MKGDFSKLEVAPYESETFLQPKAIATLLKDLPVMDNLTTYQEIITSILLYKGKYQLSPENRKHYLRNFSKLLAADPLIMQNNSANLTTLRWLSGKIYSEDRDILELKLPGKGDCSSAHRYLKDYTSILELLG